MKSEDEFQEEETTTSEEIANFLSKQGKVYDVAKIRLEEKKNLSTRINSLNKEQRKIFDELMDRDSDEQTFLYLYGTAGTGKTYLLNTIIPALEFKAFKSGMDLTKPLVLVMSPTASAAKHLLYGDTIHGCLKFNGYDNAEKQMLFSLDASMANNLSQVTYIIIDEISMVSANFLWDINKKLQTLMGSQEFFGGLHVIVTGDLHQLPPVMGPWVFQTTTIRGRCNATATNIWKCHFQMYQLQQHVRSSSDEIYSWLQENIAVGKVTDDMLPHLEARVQECPTLYENELYKDGKQIMITPNHTNKDAFNAKLLTHCDGEEHTFHADDKLSAKTTQMPDVSKMNEKQTKGLPTTLVVRKNCPIKITKNINKSDMLVNGTFGYVHDFDAHNNIIWCVFEGVTGQKTRHNSKHKHSHGLAVPITRSAEAVLVQQGGKKYSFKRTQFPLIVAYAITCHGSQGLTKECVIIDYATKSKMHASFFVAFSRATSLDNVYLMNSFKKEYVHCETNVVKEYERLANKAKFQFRNTYLYDNCFVDAVSGMQSSEEVKMAYININGLLKSNHFQCLQHDWNLLASDILVIAETMLPENTSDDDIRLNDFDLVQRVHGMVMYKKTSMSAFDVHIVETPMYQIMTCDLPFGVVSFTYIHPTINAADRTDFFNHVKSISSFVALIGDLNIPWDQTMKTNRSFYETCNELCVVSTFHEVTHLKGNQLDYVLLKKDAGLPYLAGCFKNMYSDHKSVYLRIATGENITTGSGIKTNTVASCSPLPHEGEPEDLGASAVQIRDDTILSASNTSPGVSSDNAPCQSTSCRKRHLTEDDNHAITKKSRKALPQSTKTKRNLCQRGAIVSNSTRKYHFDIWRNNRASVHLPSDTDDEVGEDCMSIPNTRVSHNSLSTQIQDNRNHMTSCDVELNPEPCPFPNMPVNPLGGVLLSQLNAMLDENLQLHDVPGDGNCLFHAIRLGLIAQGLNNAPDAQTLRNRVVDYLSSDNSNWLLDFLSIPVDDGNGGILRDKKGAIIFESCTKEQYINYIKEPNMGQGCRKFADNIEAQIISELFDLKINIYSISNFQDRITDYTITPNQNAPMTEISLVNVNQIHYMALISNRHVC